MIEDKNFTALPSGEDTPLLARRYRELLVLNIVGYLTAIQKSLGFDISFITDKYRNLETEKRFSPAIFALFSKLVLVAAEGEVPAIVDVLHQLHSLDQTQIYNSHFTLSSILTEHWENDFIYRMRKEQFPNKNNDPMLILPILSPDLGGYKNVISKFFSTIEEADIDFFREFQTNVVRVKLFNGKALLAATAAEVYGAIYLRTPMKAQNIDIYFTEHLIHEASHLQLDVLLAFDKVVLNDSSERFTAPLRVDARPMFGVFHATFVLCRMVRIFQRLVKMTADQEICKKLDEFKVLFDQGLETVHKYGVLTQKGILIRDSFVLTSEI